MSSRGWHSNRSCTLNYDLGQTFDRKKLSWHCIDFTIVGFITEILLDLDQFDNKYQRDIVPGLTVDYGEHFKLTVDFYFNRGHRSEYRMCWSATDPWYVLTASTAKHNPIHVLKLSMLQICE